MDFRHKDYQKAKEILQKHVPNRYPNKNNWVDAMIEFAQLYHLESKDTSSEESTDVQGGCEHPIEKRASAQSHGQDFCWECGKHI